MTHIWLPPPSQSVAAQGYLPGQLYNLDSKYGNKDELKALCAALKEAGIVPLADIVINHRCADEGRGWCIQCLQVSSPCLSSQTRLSFCCKLQATSQRMLIIDLKSSPSQSKS